MSNEKLWRERRHVGDPERGLTVEIRRGPDAHLAIERDNGGLVHIDLDEARPLIDVLSQAAADLAAELGAGEEHTYLGQCPACGEARLIADPGGQDEGYCPACGSVFPGAVSRHKAQAEGGGN